MSLRQKLRGIVMTQLSQGVSPEGLAMTCGFAVTLGIFPAMGMTTLLCLIFGQAFKLNQPLLQALNYLLYPLQILMIPAFLYLGEAMLRLPHLQIRPLEMIQEFGEDWRGFMIKYGFAGLHAIFAWIFVGPLMGYGVFRIFRPIFTKLKRKN